MSSGTETWKNVLRSLTSRTSWTLYLSKQHSFIILEQLIKKWVSDKKSNVTCYQMCPKMATTWRSKSPQTRTKKSPKLNLFYSVVNFHSHQQPFQITRPPMSSFLEASILREKTLQIPLMTRRGKQRAPGISSVSRLKKPRAIKAGARVL